MALLAVAYRVETTRDIGEHISDYLAYHYGPNNVVRMPTPGARPHDFANRVEATLANCRLLVVVIDPYWADAVGPDGRRWLDDPTDPVRVLVATALRLHLLIVPLLVAGAMVPPPQAIPPDMAPVVALQAVVIRDGPFVQVDLQRAVDQINTVLPWRPASGVLVMGALVIALSALAWQGIVAALGFPHQGQLSVKDGVLVVLLVVATVTLVSALIAALIMAVRRRAWWWLVPLGSATALLAFNVGQVLIALPGVFLVTQLTIIVLFGLWGPRRERLLR